MPRQCSVGKHIISGRAASGYWAWFPEPDRRTAYRALYCGKHADALITILKQGLSDQDEPSETSLNSCTGCGIAIDAEYDPTWCTAYMPGMEPLAFTFLHCYSCAAQFRVPILEAGEKLPERDEYRARAPEASPWQSLWTAT